MCVRVSMCVFKIPPTAKVIWSQCHGLKSHLEPVPWLKFASDNPKKPNNHSREEGKD